MLNYLKHRIPMKENTLSNNAQGIEKHVTSLLWLAFIFLIIGIFTPIILVKKFIFFKDPISIFDGIYMLMQNKDYLIALIVFIFSIIFPFLKIFYTAKIWIGINRNTRQIASTIYKLERLGKWSMLDVFVVGLIVFSTKASGIANATSQVGLYFFTVSIFLSILCVSLVKKTASRKSPHEYTL